MKKGEITITTILGAAFIGSFLILCFSNIVGNIASEYNVTLSATENNISTMSKMNDIYSSSSGIQGIQNSTQNAPFSWGAAVGLNLLSLYTMIQQFFGIFEVYNTMITQGLSYFGIPAEFTMFFNGLIIIAIIGVVIALLLGRDKA